MLYSDCQAALQAVGQNFVKSQMVLDTVAALNQAAHNNFIQLRWVKGHCGMGHSKSRGRTLTD